MNFALSNPPLLIPFATPLDPAVSRNIRITRTCDQIRLLALHSQNIIDNLKKRKSSVCIGLDLTCPISFLFIRPNFVPDIIADQNSASRRNSEEIWKPISINKIYIMKNYLNTELIEETKKLVQYGSHYDTKELGKLYAPNLRIVRLDHNGEVTVLNREENMAFFREREKDQLPPLETDLQIHHAERIDNNGYVFLTRRMSIAGPLEELKYHIQWQKIKGTWQIIHENVYAQPV